MSKLHLRPIAAIFAALGYLVCSNALAAADPTDQCKMCHAKEVENHQSAVHKNIPCASCHTGVKDHVTNMATRPGTNMDPKLCGTCHQDQYKSAFLTSDRPARQSKKAANGPAPDPFFDRALGGHGFTKEHDLPRAHTWMAIDQFIVDRAFGGRFEPKEGWLYTTLEGGRSYKVWDVLKDNYPEHNIQKAHRPGTAAAANGVCWSCKSTDLMLDWAFMGDKAKGAAFHRGSNPVDVVRNVQHGMNCNFCHDPHNAKPRILRDALIEAMERNDKYNVYKNATNPTKLDIQKVGARGFDRKVAYMDKVDSRLMCAQCHVEYVCNPGMNIKTGEKVGFNSRMTNTFPWVNAYEIENYYDDVGFRDFKHNLTGATLVKMQHPDTETYFGSVHDKAGADCASCHMPKVTNEKGKTYTLHWATSPKHYVKETCLTCHTDKNEKQMVTAIDAMKGHFDGKVREAEAGMNDMFNAFELALAVGVDEEVLKQARKLHESAHINWEYWTAANGAYFHNHKMAIDSLAKSAKAASDATALLRKAIAEKKVARK